MLHERWSAHRSVPAHHGRELSPARYGRGRDVQPVRQHDAASARFPRGGGPGGRPRVPRRVLLRRRRPRLPSRPLGVRRAGPRSLPRNCVSPETSGRSPRARVVDSCSRSRGDGADRGGPARRDLSAEPGHAAHHARVEGGALRAGRRRPRSRDFAFRRTHGAEAAMAVARASAMVGFVATSNVEAGRRFDLRLRARWPMRSSRPSRANARPSRRSRRITPTARRSSWTPTTPSRASAPRSPPSRRSDSGSASACASTVGTWMRSREWLAAPRRRRPPQARVFASGGLDEHEVAALIGGAPIDAFGIGTQMGVSADAPFVDSVYKLTEFDGRPTLKLSSGKASPPDASRSGARSVTGNIATPWTCGTRRDLRRPGPCSDP